MKHPGNRKTNFVQEDFTRNKDPIAERIGNTGNDILDEINTRNEDIVLNIDKAHFACESFVCSSITQEIKIGDNDRNNSKHGACNTGSVNVGFVNNEEPQVNDAIVSDNRTNEGNEEIGEIGENGRHDPCFEISPSDVEDISDETKEGQETTVHKTTRAPDGGWGWFVMLGAFLIHVINSSCEKSHGILFLQLGKKFGQSATATSIPLSINSMLRLFLGPLAGALCSRFNVRAVVGLGTTFCTFGLLASAFAPSLVILNLTYGLLFGLGRALIFTPSHIILGQYFEKRLSLAVGIASAGVPISYIFFPTVVEKLFVYYSFTSVFLLLTALIFHSYICAALFRPIGLNIRINRQQGSLERVAECTVPKNETTTSSQAPVLSDHLDLDKTDSSATYCRGKLSRLRQCLFCKHGQPGNSPKSFDISVLKNFWFVCLCIEAFLMSFNTTLAYLPALALEKTIDVARGAYLLSASGIADAFYRICVSPLLDLEVIRPYRLVVYNIAIFGIALATLSCPFMQNFNQLCIASVVFGFFNGIYFSLKSVICADVLGNHKLASSFGILLSFQGVGILIGPILGGYIKDRFGSFELTFYVGTMATFFGGAFLTAGGIWLYHQRRHSRTINK